MKPQDCKKRCFKYILLCAPFLCIVLSYSLVTRSSVSTPDAVNNVVLRHDTRTYTRISIHNRDLSNLLKLFQPYDIETELKRPKLRVLEIGCGEGNTLLEVVSLNPSLDATCLNAPKSVYTMRSKEIRPEESYGVLLKHRGKDSWLTVCREYNITCPQFKYPSMSYGLVENTKFESKFDIIFSRGALYYVQDRGVWKHLLDNLDSSLNPGGIAFLQVLFHIRKSKPKGKREENEIIASVRVSDTSYAHLYWSREAYEPGIGGYFSSINLILFKEDIQMKYGTARDPFLLASQPTSCLGPGDYKKLERMILEVGNRKKGSNVAHGIASYVHKSVPPCS